MTDRKLVEAKALLMQRKLDDPDRYARAVKQTAELSKCSEEEVEEFWAEYLAETGVGRDH